MSKTLARLEAFIEEWRRSLESCAEVAFHIAAREGAGGAPVQIADSYVTEHGFKPIGFDWELLDPMAGAQETRSALGAFADALTKDLAMRSDWLGEEKALACGQDFLSAFDPLQAVILTNHITRQGGKSEGWNPITTATYEWAFVGYDDSAIAFLLLTAED